MFRDKKFRNYAIAFMILGVVFMFMYSGLQNDQINIINSFTSWNAEKTTAVMTWGNFACIILTFIYGTCYIKFGVKKTMIPLMIITALGCIGIAAANGLRCNGGTGNWGLFWVSLFTVRCACMSFQMGGFMLCANWFVRYRGRVMGVITLGSPLFSVVGTAVMTRFIANQLGGDYRPFYIGIAVVIILIAVLTGLLIKDYPEDAGLHPDGNAEALKSEADGDEIQLSVGQVLKMGKAWQLIIAYGIFTFIINACMGSMAVRFQVIAPNGMGDLSVWLVAVKWLGMGAILGIPMSYIFGIFDDKLGSVKASIILGLTELIPVLGLMLQPQGGSIPLMVMWGFGVACMTGGVPTMHPCMTAYAFGRREYQSANRIIMAVQLIPSAFAAQWMVGLIIPGKANMAYGILIGLIIIGIITMCTMLKMPDANAVDRDYADKQVAAK
jgi:OFA family oxalate/formate antiporter-like MFS transporter